MRRPRVKCSDCGRVHADNRWMWDIWLKWDMHFEGVESLWDAPICPRHDADKLLTDETDPRCKWKKLET